MTDPVTRLNAALEGRYRIERQLGEGRYALSTSQQVLILKATLLRRARWSR